MPRAAHDRCEPHAPGVGCRRAAISGMGIAVHGSMPTRSPSRPNPVKFVRFLSVEPYTRIKSLTAVVRHFGDLGRAGSDTSRFTRSTLPRVVPCADPLVGYGGYV